MDVALNDPRIIFLNIYKIQRELPKKLQPSSFFYDFKKKKFFF